MRRMLLLALVILVLAVSLHPAAVYSRAVQAYNTANLLNFKAVASPHLEPKV